MANLKVNIAGVELKNPIIPASGTFGFGYEKFFNFSKLGAIVSKGTTLNPKDGNDSPRIAESPSGVINSVGLQNNGIDHFIKYLIPYYKSKNDVIIANIAGFSIEEYISIAEKLDSTDISLLEINISCPNAKNAGIAFGTDPTTVENLISKIRKVTTKPIIVKLSPNVTDITEIAKAAESGGANCLSLINTILSMRIDINNKRPIIKNNMGGLSGEAIFPIALRMVYQVKQSVSIPIIGIGGVSNAKMAIEMMIAGASAVQVGSAIFKNPCVCIDIINDINNFLESKKINDINHIINSVIPW